MASVWHCQADRHLYTQVSSLVDCIFLSFCRNWRMTGSGNVKNRTRRTERCKKRWTKKLRMLRDGAKQRLTLRQFPIMTFCWMRWSKMSMHLGQIGNLGYNVILRSDFLPLSSFIISEPWLLVLVPCFKIIKFSNLKATPTYNHGSSNGAAQVSFTRDREKSIMDIIVAQLQMLAHCKISVYDFYWSVSSDTVVIILMLVLL